MQISVVTPVYNAEKFLDRCVQSVLQQTYQRIELILVNDGSTDGSEEICRRYALQDSRVKVISQENKGPAAARNAGVRQAAGDFLFFLDADDFISRNALEIMVAAYHQYRPDMVMGHFHKLVNGNNRIRPDVSFRVGEGPFQKQMKELSRTEIGAYVRHFLRHPSNHPISYCWARLYTVSIIRSHRIAADENMHLFEDLVFNLEYLKHCQKILFVNEPLYTYTMHPHHVSASMAPINADRLLHDMKLFKAKTAEFLRQPVVGAHMRADIQKDIGHALTHYLIIFLVRSCRLVSSHNRIKLFAEIRKIMNASLLQDCLRCYSPSKGNSRFLPWLMKLQWVNAIVFVCRHKAYKRYGRPEKALG